MKKTVYITLVLVAIISTACGSAPNNVNPATSPQGNFTAGELPEMTQLVIGTLKLEDTNQPVSADQAAELLPLWQTMQVLSESDTASQKEIDALVEQIKETMTAEQRQAIKDMNLTREDMTSVLQEQGLAVGNGPAGGQNNNAPGGNQNGGGGFGPGGFPGGAPPQGGFPGGGQGGGGQGSGLTPDQIATAQASRQQTGGSRVPPMLVNALIAYLQEKVGA